MSAPKAPTPPDPRETAAAQTGTNVATAIANAGLNQVNQVGPDGSLTYTQSGSTSFRDPSTGQTYQIPRYTATTQLSDAQQAIHDQNNATSLNTATLGNEQSQFLREHMAQGMDFSGLPDRAQAPGGDFGIQRGPGGQPNYQTSYVDDFSKDRQRVEDSINANLDRRHARDRESMDARLADQGIARGSEAYSRAQNDFQSGVDRSRIDAHLSAGQEQSRLAGLSRDQAAFGNQARGQGFTDMLRSLGFNNQAAGQEANLAFRSADAQNNNRAQSLSEMFAMRNQPINEINSLRSGSQVSQPNFVNTPQQNIATTDYAGLVNQNYAQQQQQYQQQAAQRNQMLGGLFGLGSTLLMSDIRLKEDISEIGRLKNGLKVYAFKYIGDAVERVGLMAQEVAKLIPEAVVTMPSGFMAVDYRKAVQ